MVVETDTGREQALLAAQYAARTAVGAEAHATILGRVGELLRRPLDAETAARRLAELPPVIERKIGLFDELASPRRSPRPPRACA